MKLKKLFAAALALCMLISLVSMSVFAESMVEISAATIDVIKDAASVEKWYSFTPDKSGTYLVYGSVNTSYGNWSANVSVTGPNGFSVVNSDRVQIEAKAGEEYTIHGFWGIWQDDWENVTMVVTEAVPAQSIEFTQCDEGVETVYLPEEGTTTYNYFYFNISPENVRMDEIICTSSNEKVATVYQTNDTYCMIQPLTAGETNITVSIGGVSDTFLLIVKDKQRLELNKEVVLKGSTLNEPYFEVLRFTAPETGTYVFHGHDVGFEAYVEGQGSLPMGYAKLQVELEAGQSVELTVSFYCAEEYGTSRTIVVQKAVSAEKIRIMQDEEYLWVDDNNNKMVLDIVLEPANARREDIVYTSSDEKVATVDDNGYVTPVAPGTCIITASIGNSSDSVKVYVNQYLDLEVGKAESVVGGKNNYARGSFVAPEDGTYVISGEKLQFMVDDVEMLVLMGFDRLQFTATKGQKIGISIYPIEEEGNYPFKVEKAVPLKSFSVETCSGKEFVGINLSDMVYLKTEPANAYVGAVQWVSTDASVLTVSPISNEICIVGGFKKGEATIVATVDGIFASKTIAVDYYQPFGDVAVNKYYYEPVLWAVDMGITGGYKDGTFRPDKTCTRAEVVTFLWRAAGEPKPATAQNPFADVATDKYYYDSVLWALENEITSGYKDGTFQPSKTCSRAEVVTFLWRAAGSPKPTKTDNPFEDVASDKYYYDAVLWAVEMGITTGKTATTFQPSATCTRAQIVTFLFRFLVGE